VTKHSPGPWVDYSRPEPAPWANNRGVVKFIEFPVRIPAMTRRAFQLYWMKHHSPHVMNATGFSQFMRKYNTGHVYPTAVAGLPSHYRQDTPFEGASEVWINSLDEVADWLGHPLYAELIQPDEPRFIRQDGSGEVIVSKEERLFEPDLDMRETGLTKLYLLVRGRSGEDHDVLHAGISEFARRILGQPSLQRQLRKLVVSHRLRPPLPEGLPLADIDAVLELWFDGERDVQRFFQDPGYAVVHEHEADAIDSSHIRAVVARMHCVHDEFSLQPSTTQPLPFGW
jgi:EthD domain